MKLALEGGTPVRKKAFPDWPHYDDAERAALLRALDQGQWWRMTGQEVSAFEEAFAAFHHAPGGALAVSNGTQALEAALLTLGIGRGDEVIVPAFTFIATSMAVQRVGATAVPVDVDMNTYCMTLETLMPAITPKTKAVIPVHMAGHPVDMLGLTRFLSERNIFIIQDACHAHGAVSQEKYLGEWNSIACFSFQNYKLMTAGEGGAMIFPTHALREKAFLIHNCGRPQGDTAYLHQELGSNYRMNEFTAAVLREQLKRLPEQNTKRESNARIMNAELNAIPGIISQSRENYVSIHPHYMAMFLIDPAVYPSVDRDHVVDALVAEGIPAFKNYKPIYRAAAFWKDPAPSGNAESWSKKCPNTERISSQGIWIHHRALLGTEADVLDVIDAIKKVLRG